MNRLITAISTLTVLPVDYTHWAKEEDLSASVLYFPIVGLFIGAFLKVATELLHPIFSPAPLSALMVLLLILITGGLHLDGLADLCDGLSAARGKGDRERILESMKDSRIGAFGAMGLIALLLLKYSFFYELIVKEKLRGFLAMGIISRYAMAQAAAIGRYARKEEEGGAGRPFIGKVGLKRAIGAAVTAFFLSGFISGGSGLIAFFVVSLATFLFIRFLDFKLGGITGDVLGAINEVSEILAVMVIVVIR